MNVFDQSIRCQPTYVAPCVLNNEQSSTKELRGEKKNHTAHKHTHTRRANEKQTNKFNAFIVEEKFSLAFVANAFLLPCHAMLCYGRSLTLFTPLCWLFDPIGSHERSICICLPCSCSIHHTSFLFFCTFRSIRQNQFHKKVLCS